MKKNRWNKHAELRIVRKHGYIAANHRVPKGGMDGYDRKGRFYVDDYRVHEYKGHCENRKGQPFLVLHRLDAMTDRWYYSLEANDTTEDILALYNNAEDLCQVDSDALYDIWSLTRNMNRVYAQNFDAEEFDSIIHGSNDDVAVEI